MTALFDVMPKAFISVGRQVAAVQINKLVSPPVGCPEDGSSRPLGDVIISTYDELHDVRSLRQACDCTKPAEC
jgi:hypothetical protein